LAFILDLGGEPLVSDISGAPMDVALFAMALKEARLRNDADVRIMKTAMEIQESLLIDLLKSMGIGTNIDTVA
jgi:hypothetical protein